ncbi:protein kinase [Actinomadura barringtoniae]|uniref:non-specific serine/threonine protein kinase n=2 Tax=Actinomadura barringtoniae TaxID=1427535 RepID=A0A939T8C3_9ACTN|nr:protein kinase [Actinomadura barringtoniae]
MRCSDPGCPGSVQDGYCDTCGLPPAPAGDPCGEPSCRGRIADGYCDVCGIPAPAPTALAAAPRTAGSSVSAPWRPGFRGSGRAGSGGSGTPPKPGLAGSGSMGSRGSGRTGTSGRTSGRTSGPSRRGMLGAGLVEVPSVPYRDPAAAVMADPEVPENKRYCGSCDAAVGRGRGDRPGRTEGFCSKCGAAYSFAPKLLPGDLVGGQYEVLGCLAHGGLGWIYLAKDKNVSDRWVVLKGLLDSGDPDAMAAALAERRFLAAVEHPNVVKIYNFVQHGGAGYIVMEYVGGSSLREILLERRHESGESLPLPQVIAYGLEVLRALGYLHDLGLVYCDFKPDNAIQTEEQLRLIDLGGVRPIDEVDGPIYGTVGYQAPEIADVGPSVESDLYTVARSMAVMSFEFTGYTHQYEFSLPPRKDVDVLARYGSFDRLLRRATHAEPAERFSSAAEMADQLTGVLRETLAGEDGRPRPAVSDRFGPELRVAGTRGVATPEAAELMAALPLPLVDGDDPASGYLAGLAAARPEAIIRELSKPKVSSVEVELRLARAHIEAGSLERARELLAGGGDDWRRNWYLALATLAENNPDLASHGFEMVYGLLPGEAAPKLGLAVCAELRGEYSWARHFYDLVWRTDRSYVSAAFGLARAHLAQGDRAGAVKALASVPATSSHYVDAQVGAVLAVLRGRKPKDLRQDELVEASERLELLGLDPERHGRLAALLLESSLAQVLTQGGSANGATVLGAGLNEHDLRAALEGEYRELARLAHGPAERLALVDRANAVRPKTMI